MSSGLRQPFPWEADQTPRKVEADLPPLVAADDLSPVFPEVALVDRVGRDPDPNRARRGAQGAADAVFEESQARGWGMDRQACRDRVNTARQRSQ